MSLHLGFNVSLHLGFNVSLHLGFNVSLHLGFNVSLMCWHVLLGKNMAPKNGLKQQAEAAATAQDAAKEAAAKEAAATKEGSGSLICG